MILSLISNSLFGNPIDIGTKAPDLITTDHTGAKINLGEELSSGTTLVFFYPKAMTPGCTKQACSLRDGWDELKQRKVKVFGVSGDTAELQKEFRDKHELPFTLIADTDLAVANAFGKGRWSRQAYIFHEGELVWRDLSASTGNQMIDILEALEALNL